MKGTLVSNPSKPFAVWSPGWQAWIAATEYPVVYVLSPEEPEWHKISSLKLWKLYCTIAGRRTPNE